MSIMFFLSLFVLVILVFHVELKKNEKCRTGNKLKYNYFKFLFYFN